MNQSEEATSRFRKTLQISYEVTATLVKSLILAGAMIMFVMQVTEVQGSSMEPNLQSEERLVLDKISGRFLPYEHGEIVVVELADSDVALVKRVIATEGETVAIQGNQLYLNGVLVDEPYLDLEHQRDFAPIIVPAEHLFVMGDNRNVSRDSRSFGAVDVYRVVGRARLRVWPPNAVGLLR